MVISLRNSSTNNLHLLPRLLDVAILGYEAHDRLAPLARIWTVAFDIGRNVRSPEVPDPDAFSFDLRSPNATAILVERVAKSTVRSNNTATSLVVITVCADDISSTLLGCHGALSRLGMQGDFIA